MMHKLHYALLLAALITGAGLRIHGLAWGLPDRVHATYSYHPDEAALLDWASDLHHGRIISKQFIYGGTLYLSTLEAGSRLAAWLGGDPNPGLRERMLVARAASALFAVLAILVTYAAGARLFSPLAGAWAALVLALAPGHVVAAQVARPDALFALLLALNLWCAARVLRAARVTRWHLLAAGAALGVAVASRFPAALWWLGHAIALAISGARRGPGARPRALLTQLAALSATALLCYCLASPHSLRYPAVLLDGLATQFSYQRGGAPVDLAGHGGVWHYGGSVMAEAIGFGSYAPALLALLCAAWRRTRADIVLLSFALPYFAALATSHWVVVRYFVPLLPLLAIWLGRLIEQGLRAAPPCRAVCMALLVCALGFNAVTLTVYAHSLSITDSRDRALAWLAAHAAPGTRIGVLQGYAGDVFFHPPAVARFRWQACALDSCAPADFFATDADLFVVADSYLVERDAAGRRLGVAAALAARSDLEAVARFEPVAHWRGYDIRPQFRTQDMREALLGLTLYRRRADAAGERAQPFR